MRMTWQAVAWALGAAAAWGQMGTGGITATAVDEAGKPVAGMYVSVVPLGTAGGFTRTVTSGAKGEVEIGRLRAGFYQLCLSQTGTAYLDPCHWSKPVVVSVGTGQTVAAGKLVAAKGSMLRVRVDDDATKRYLDKAKTAGTDPRLGLLMPNGTLQPLRVTANDVTGRSYEIAIPVERSLQLAVYAGSLTMTDAKGAAVGPSAATVAGQGPGKADGPALVPVRHSAAGNNPDVRFTVTGVKQP